MMHKTPCCGLKQFEGLSDNPEASFGQIAQSICNEMKTAFVLFTDPIKYGRGEKLKKFIIENDLGHVVETRVAVNPNSNNELKAYLYEPDMAKVTKWLDKYHKRLCGLKVGDKVVGTHSTRYGITSLGWKGIVAAVVSPNEIRVSVDGHDGQDYDGCYTVDPAYFEIIPS